MLSPLRASSLRNGRKHLSPSCGPHFEGFLPQPRFGIEEGRCSLYCFFPFFSFCSWWKFGSCTKSVNVCGSRAQNGKDSETRHCGFSILQESSGTGMACMRRSYLIQQYKRIEWNVPRRENTAELWHMIFMYLRKAWTLIFEPTHQLSSHGKEWWQRKEEYQQICYTLHYYHYS